MKRGKIFVLLLAALMFCSATAFTQETQESKPFTMHKRMKKAKMGKHYMMGGMMKMMMKKQMVATEDGGVIVMAGNKLQKYDSNLNLVKEVELKIDIEACYKMIKRMKEECPWYKEMMEEKKAKEQEKE